MKAEHQKIEIEHYITRPPIDVIREGDWYRADNNDKIGLINLLAKSPKVCGLMYNMVNEAINEEAIKEEAIKEEINEEEINEEDI